ncbi:ATP-dependent zinc metalloprotease FTSH 1, chloroplastic-like [Dorcoceras hygrometricum]|uniref:ATP-dependent zinc metalloprotease FTSH 1, chloroplastic-like n=1 Tax=Dorcoceras hygrometricum TaxID=472368 RepID=A0A2Z7D5A1_9LAMI|nr:ATP-dependent zinc metalloprotease FTSH 1, chloroplastic-like [Dorcoceras hygrometricum]
MPTVLMGGRSKFDIFIKHFDKVTLLSGDLQAICKYCSKSYKWQHEGGYGTLNRHIEKNHPVKIDISRTQTQIPTFSSQYGNDSQLFKFLNLNLGMKLC